jgi:hypothetical protein
MTNLSPVKSFRARPGIYKGWSAQENGWNESVRKSKKEKGKMNAGMKGRGIKNMGILHAYGVAGLPP